MSRSSKQAGEVADRRAQALDQIQTMIEQGRSFSGRERNCCFLNLPGGRFTNISASSGLDFPDDGRAVVVTDWDQDGDLDLWFSNRNAPRLRFFRNDHPAKGGYLALRLVGNGNTSNRDAIGARVEVHSGELDGRRLVQTLRAGEGFMAQSSKWLHFGLGTLQTVSAVSVHWPNGKTESFSGVKLNRRHQIVQGTGVAKLLPSIARKSRLYPSPQLPERDTESGAIPLAIRLPMPNAVSIGDFGGGNYQLEYRKGKSTLIVFWASWCRPCLQELQELVDRYADLQNADIDVVALSVDGLGEDATNLDFSREFAKKLNAPFRVGRASPEFVQLMTGYHHMLVYLARPLPIPSSYLVDPFGRLTAIYKGRIEIEELLRHSKSNPQTIPDRLKATSLLKGRTIDRKEIYGSYRRSEANTRIELAKAFFRNERFGDAETHLRALLKIEPEFGEAHQWWAHVLEETGRNERAATSYTRALKYLPKQASLHFDLGNVLLKSSRFENAIASYRKALQLKPRYYQAHVNLGVALMRIKQYPEAKTEFREALAIEPDHENARRYLERIRMLQQE
jgi:tetratricopeptide (TPR) repeat protein